MWLGLHGATIVATRSHTDHRKEKGNSNQKDFGNTIKLISRHQHIFYIYIIYIDEVAELKTVEGFEP